MKERKFTNARLTLTLWYGLFLFFIVMAFSVVLFATESGNFARVVLQRNFGNRPPRILTLTEIQELQEQVEELRRSFIVDLIIIDGVILLVGGGLGYLLAGKTLEPIRRTFEEQKTFLANASHEFRTPLAAIRTASEVVLRSKTKTKEDYKKVLEQTLQETTRMGILADELLMLSRIDAGIVKLQLTKSNLSTIVEDAITEVSTMAQEKKLRITKNIAPNVMLYADANRLKQLVLILLDNAVKFTKSGGVITVDIAKSPKVCLRVKDTGGGIATKDIPHIFDRFYQADAARGGNSAGLGLSIAQWIVSSHTGIITVQSTVGKGSTFTVTFASKTSK